MEIPLEIFEDTFNDDDIGQPDESINFFKYKEISDYPSSMRDFSFMVTDLDTIDKISQKSLSLIQRY